MQRQENIISSEIEGERETNIVETMQASMLVDPDELENIYKSTMKKRTKLLHVKNVNEKNQLFQKFAVAVTGLLRLVKKNGCPTLVLKTQTFKPVFK